MHCLAREHSPLEFEGEELAKVYGEWWQGIIWSQYHNYAVYRTTQGEYILAIHFRTRYAAVHAVEQPHDYAVLVHGKIDALARALADYDPLAHVLDPGYGYALDAEYGVVGENFLRKRFKQQGDALLALVGRVEKGEAPPLRLTVIVEYGDIDDDVRAQLAERGVTEGIGPAEALRRSIIQHMEAQGETGVTVIVQGGEDADDEEGEGSET